MAWWRPSAAPDASFVEAADLEPYRGAYIADDDRYQQMLDDAKRAYEFVMWHFGRPPHVPAPSVPFRAPPKAPTPFEGAPLRPPVPPDGYNEWDLLNRFYEDSELLDSDPGILAPDPVPGATLDRRMEIDPRTVLTPQFPLRKRIAR
jgi:hypothetical protein